MSASSPKPLSREQLDFFGQQGYLIVEDALDDRDLQPVIDELRQVVDANARELHAQGKLENLHADEPFETRLAKLCEKDATLAKNIWNGVLHGPAIFNLIRNPKLLDIAEQMCGPELIASSVYRIRPKIPRHFQGAVPWHQDSGYFEPYCDNDLVLTMWIPLVDATDENGCLWVLPGVHKGPVVRHHRDMNQFYLEIRKENLPAGEAICCPVPKGGVLLLNNRTPHASFDNNTDLVRWSMDLRYQNAKLPTNAKITRLPGEDVPGVEVPVACFPPEADFLVRSKARPDEVVTDPRVFDDIRANHVAGGMTDRWQLNNA